ncbi:MAG: bacteriohemerythrin [Spirochaetaceae bacterium]|jgi:methyl-accepting chemotaxis protein|nr:bacteriohemerythrin [Spirochaetaceae bacterium]
MKLSVRISLLISVLVLSLTVAIGLTAFIVSSSIIEDTARESLENQAALGADLVTASVDAQLRILQEFAVRAEMRAMDMENLRNLNTSFGDSIDRTGFLDVAVVTPDGTARYYKDQTSAFLGDRDYVKSAFTGKLSVSDVLISRVTGQPVLMFAVPIQNETGTVVGVLVGRRDGNALTDIVKNVTFGESGYAYMVNGNGTFVSHRDSELVTTQYNPIEAAKTDPEAASLARAVEDVLKTETGFLRYTFNNRDTYASFVPVEGFSWKFIVTVERGALLAGISRLTMLIGGAGLVLLLIGIVVAILIGRSVSKPLNFSARALKDISEGEGDLTRRLDIKSKDEIGDLARYFNKMVAKIEELIILIKGRSLTLRQISNGLNEQMALTAASIKDINDAVVNVNARVKEQSESVGTSIVAMSLVSENIDSLDEEVVQQAKSVEESSSAVTKMLESIRLVTDTLVANGANVKRLMEASEVGRNRLADVVADIQGIARESEGLLEINAVMENVASQTNLLSMNAAIEAAHAGESGRGFAVVAGEIRKLAASSAEQSKTIAAVLQKIKSSIDKITLSTDSVSSEFESIDGGIKTVARQEESIRGAMEEQGEGSRLILEEIGRLKEITTLVKEGTSQMLEKSKSVIKESKNLEGLSAEIKFSMDEMAAGAGSIISSVRDMNTAGGINKENIDTLVEEVSRFKVSKAPVVAGTATPDYVWDETFATGNKTIDRQHKTLFDALNRLLAAMRAGEAGGKLKEAIDFLNDYTIKHFFDEEQIQQQARYPGYPEHHRMHEDFKATVQKLARQLILKGPEEDLIDEVRKRLGEWLVTHIKGQDIKLGAYLAKRAVRAN